MLKAIVMRRADSSLEMLERNVSTECMEIRRLYISAGHNFFGHHGKPPGQYPMLEVTEIECVAGHGLRGDRFFDFRENYQGQITFFASETYEAISEELGVRGRPLSVFRRNVITAGVDLNKLIGCEFQIQDVRFRGVEECRPCHWMDRAFAPGAFELMKGHGGLRATILSNGLLRAGAK
jgi:MOSC domain-containing protein YiiM